MAFLPRRGVAAMFAGLVALSLGCGMGSKEDSPAAGATPPSPTNPTAPSGAEGRQIRFEVTASSGKASMINWSTVEDSAIVNDAKTPWMKTVTLEDKYGLIGVNATASDGKTIACKLYVDGKLVDEGESDGSVNCSDTVSP